MKWLNLHLLLACLVAAIAVSTASAAPPEPLQKVVQQDPTDASGGKVYSWQSADDLSYEYRIPKDYDPEAGANLTFVLHGSNLSRSWTFLNHDQKTFRPDDIVVSPDGTTSNGGSGFNFLQGEKDLERLHALQAELEGMFNVRSTFLYGHSQGSFFSFYYAGAYPEDVEGLVGQASGVWIGTQGSKKHHHQAVVLMHGTADPVVGYGQSVGGLEYYVERKYPMVRLRSLDGWNHWPTQLHTSQQLAWCEGMTTDDSERLVAAFEELNGVKEGLDPVAFRQVAARAVEMEGVPDKVKKAAQKGMDAVDKVTAKHVAAIEKSVGKNKRRSLDDGSWVVHSTLFFRHFSGTEGCDELREDWKKTLASHESAAKKHWAEYRRTRESDPKDAFIEGLSLVEDAFLLQSVQDSEFLHRLDGWAKDAKDHGIDRKRLKQYEELVPTLRKAMESGPKAFEKVDRRLK